jgi:gluconolactonase
MNRTITLPPLLNPGSTYLVAYTDAHEGPVYVADEDALYFTTVRTETVAIKRLALADGSVSVVRADANTANGMALDREGRLVVCEQGTLTEPARITRVDRKTGAVETLVDAWRGLPLNSPNDVVVKSDGTIWFTDPSYGHVQGFRPEPQTGDHVYRYDPASGKLNAVADSLDKPNGLSFSPDERVLYIGDNGDPHHLLAFHVEDDARLTGGKVLAVSTPEHPDGLKTDSAGRIYASYSGGVQVFDPSGHLIGEINLPGPSTSPSAGRTETPSSSRPTRRCGPLCSTRKEHDHEADSHAAHHRRGRRGRRPRRRRAGGA